VLVVLLITVIVTDYRWTKIPNVVTYPVMLIGLSLSVLEAFPGALFGRGFIDHLAALVLAFALAWPFWTWGGIKAGDAKLLMAVAALRGTSFFLVSTLYGALLGGVFAIAFIARKRLVPAGAAGTPTMSVLMKAWMPYGVSLALGGLLALVLEITGVITLGTV
jgi:prepilin peptidase CpaA